MEFQVKIKKYCIQLSGCLISRKCVVFLLLLEQTKFFLAPAPFHGVVSLRLEYFPQTVCRAVSFSSLCFLLKYYLRAFSDYPIQSINLPISSPVYFLRGLLKSEIILFVYIFGGLSPLIINQKVNSIVHLKTQGASIMLDL